MALTDTQLNMAKAEARAFLEYSVYMLAVLLGVDTDDISGTMVIPVAVGHHEYPLYESLKKQATILENLV